MGSRRVGAQHGVRAAGAGGRGARDGPRDPADPLHVEREHPRIVVGFVAANAPLSICSQAIRLANALLAAVMASGVDPTRAANTLTNMVSSGLAEGAVFLVLIALVAAGAARASAAASTRLPRPRDDDQHRRTLTRMSGRALRRRLRTACDQQGVATTIQAVAWAAKQVTAEVWHESPARGSRLQEASARFTPEHAHSMSGAVAWAL